MSYGNAHRDRDNFYSGTERRGDHQDHSAGRGGAGGTARGRSPKEKPASRGRGLSGRSGAGRGDSVRARRDGLDGSRSDSREDEGDRRQFPRREVQSRETAAGHGRGGVPLVVSGCQNPTISDIVCGRYLPSSTNHRKVVYKKEERSRGLDVLIYYWDERDGPELCGWWFGPNVGGDQVWAYHPSRTAATPPPREWNVPHDGPIDPTFSVTAERNDVEPRRAPAPVRRAPRVEGSGVGSGVAAAAAAAALSAAAPPTHRGLQYIEAEPVRERARSRELREADKVREPARAKESGRGGPTREMLRETPREQSRATAAEEKEKDKEKAKEKTQPQDASKAAWSSSASSHAYFVNAYNRRREERAKAEEAKRKQDEERNNEMARAHADEEETKREELRKQMEAMKKEEEEEKRQMEQLKQRAEERRRREDELSRKTGKVTASAAMRGAAAGAVDSDGRPEAAAPKAGRSKRSELQATPKDPPREPSARQRSRSPDNNVDVPPEKNTRAVASASAARAALSERRGGERQIMDRKNRSERAESRGNRDADRGAWDRDHRQDQGSERDRRGGTGARREEARRVPAPEEERAKKREEERAKREDEPKRHEEERRRRDRENQRQEDDRRREERRRREEDESRKRDEERRRDEEESIKRREDDRVRREEEKRKKEEDRRRLEEDLQRRRDEKRQREENERRRSQERRRKDDEVEQKEINDKKIEEEQKQKTAPCDGQENEMEPPKKGEDESLQLRQQQATLSVLRVLQKLANANPKNFDALNAELESVLKADLPETGEQMDVLRAEADRVLAYAKQYVEQVSEQQRKWEELRVEQQQKKDQQERKVREALKELGTLVSAAESASEQAHYTAAPLAGPHQLDNVEVLRITHAVQLAGKSAMSACSACADFLVQKLPLMDEAEKLKAESHATISQMQPRIQAATRQATEALQLAKENKDSIAKKVECSRCNVRKKEKFANYDKDRDGFLSREEISGFAKAEYNFDIPDQNLDRIWRQLVQNGHKGISLDNFQLLITSVGIARNEVRGQLKRQQRLEKEMEEKRQAEQKENMIREKKASLSMRARELCKELEPLEASVAAPEAEADALATAASSLQPEELKQKATCVVASVRSAEIALADIKGRLDSLCAEIKEVPEFIDALKDDILTIGGKGDAFDKRLRKATGFAHNAKQLAHQKEFAEYETLRMEIAAKLRVTTEAEGGKVDDLYAALSSDGSGDIVTKDDIIAFLQKHQCDVAPEKVDSLISQSEDLLALGGQADIGDAVNCDAPPASKRRKTAEGAISKEDFGNLIRIFYKVVKDIVLSDNLWIEKSGQIRRMDVGEVMEVYKGPTPDPSVGVYRIHGKALRDGVVGWVTVAGNQGITFLLPGGNLFKVLRKTPFTEELKDLDGPHSVEEGDILQVVEWSRTSKSALGVTRIRARVQGEKKYGWASISDAGGTPYLEVL